jgi:hypothetical protein
LSLILSPKYNIFNFTESYRNAEHKHTILLPVVMGLVVLGCFWLVTKTRPTTRKIFANKPPSAAVATKTTTEIAITAPPKIKIDFGSDLDSFPVIDPAIVLPPIPKPEDQDIVVPVAKLVPTPSVSKEGLPLIPAKSAEKFTDWMTPTELNNYILALNQGHQISFWDRGYWIVSVEGRWAANRQEYRIVYDKTPLDADFQWRYRIAQSGEIFNQNILELKQEGFSLYQSQVFYMPNQMTQYQAVWMKSNP